MLRTVVENLRLDDLDADPGKKNYFARRGDNRPTVHRVGFEISRLAA